MTKEVNAVMLLADKTAGAWSYSDLEASLIGISKIKSYHDVKSIILEADRLGLYPNAIKNYLQTNKNAHDYLSLELSGLDSKYGVQ